MVSVSDFFFTLPGDTRKIPTFTDYKTEHKMIQTQNSFHNYDMLKRQTYEVYPFTFKIHKT